MRPVFSARGFGARGAWEHLSAQPRTAHSLFLINRQATMNQYVSWAFSGLIIMPRFLVGGYIIMPLPKFGWLKACIDDSGNDTPHFYRPVYKWKHASKTGETRESG